MLGRGKTRGLSRSLRGGHCSLWQRKTSGARRHEGGGSPALQSLKRSRSMASLTGEGSPALARQSRRKGFETNYAALKAAAYFVGLRKDALGPFRGRHTDAQGPEN